MHALLRELASSAHACALDSAVVNAKMRLGELATTIMSSPSPAEFAALRDELTELMLELPAGCGAAAHAFTQISTFMNRPSPA